MLTSDVGHPPLFTASYLSATPRARSKVSAMLRSACEARRGISSQCLINWEPLVNTETLLGSSSLIGRMDGSLILTRIARVEGGLVDIVACRHTAGTCQMYQDTNCTTGRENEQRTSSVRSGKFCCAIAGLITLSIIVGPRHVCTSICALGSRRR